MSNRLAMTGFILALAVTSSSAVLAQSSAAEEASNPFVQAPPTKLPYDKEYPVIHYGRMPTHNAIALLAQRLAAGEVKLTYSAPRGYLDSLLAALNIDASSQALVYSKTSLQTGAITAATPRALYFDTDTYVGYVQGSRNLELATMDSELGQVFYILPNHEVAAPQLERQTLTCLACHDTYELSGGGVPRFLLMSSYVNIRGDQLTHEDNILTTDETPMESRWGGWYVTGQTGKQKHVGNILVKDVQELVKLDSVRRENIDTLDGLFDTKPYLTDKSDVVALLVLQHQVTVQDLLTRANFEVRNALARVAGRSPAPCRRRPAVSCMGTWMIWRRPCCSGMPYPTSIPSGAIPGSRPGSRNRGSKIHRAARCVTSICRPDCSATRSATWCTRPHSTPCRITRVTMSLANSPPCCRAATRPRATHCGVLPIVATRCRC